MAAPQPVGCSWVQKNPGSSPSQGGERLAWRRWRGQRRALSQQSLERQRPLGSSGAARPALTHYASDLDARTPCSPVLFTAACSNPASPARRRPAICLKTPLRSCHTVRHAGRGLPRAWPCPSLGTAPLSSSPASANDPPPPGAREPSVAAERAGCAAGGSAQQELVESPLQEVNQCDLKIKSPGR